MPTAPKIVQLPYTYWTERASAPVVAIIGHNTVGTDSRTYLSQGGPRKVSIHALIQKDGTLYRMVPDERGANHAGYGTMPDGYPKLNPNRCTIGFELENFSDGKGRVDPYTDAQLMTMGWEINRVRAKFGKLPILRHAELDPKRRADTVGLTVNEMNVWAHKAATFFATAAHTRYRVRGLPVYEQSNRQGPQWGCLKQDEVIEIDDPSDGHLADGRGFIRFDPDTLEAI